MAEKNRGHGKACNPRNKEAKSTQATHAKWQQSNGKHTKRIEIQIGEKGGKQPNRSAVPSPGKGK